MHLPMWAFRQGRPLPMSRGNTLPQRGRRNTSHAVSTISRTAKLEVYGPMYSAFSSSFCSAAEMRGQPSCETLT